MSKVSEFKIVTKTIYVFQLILLFSGVFCVWRSTENIHTLTGVFLMIMGYQTYKAGRLYRECYAKQVLDLIKNDPYQKLNRNSRRKLARHVKKNG